MKLDKEPRRSTDLYVVTDICQGSLETFRVIMRCVLSFFLVLKCIAVFLCCSKYRLVSGGCISKEDKHCCSACDHFHSGLQMQRDMRVFCEAEDED